MIERFITVAGGTLKIYYNLSTWNPYTIVRMRSELKITQINAGGVVNNAGYNWRLRRSPRRDRGYLRNQSDRRSSCLPPPVTPLSGAMAS